jgi:hypothetical protein
MLLRRILAVSSVLFVPAAVAVLSPAAAANTSSTVNLSGTVDSTLELTSAPTAAATALPLNTAAQQTVHVSDLTITTNNAQGYTLNVTGNSQLTKATGETPIDFVVGSVDDAGDGTTAVFVTPNGTAQAIDSTTTAGTGTTQQDLYIQYTPAALQDPGAYNATITLAVVDNT